MIESLTVSNFTRFGNETFQFSPGLNVFVGENGTGKTHIMKLLYANLKALQKPSEQSNSKTFMEPHIAKHLMEVFKPDYVGRLAQRMQGLKRADVCMSYKPRGKKAHSLNYSFSTTSRNSVSLINSAFEAAPWPAVFIPTREILSIFPNFAPLYDAYETPFDVTWRDLAGALGKPPLKGPHNEYVKALLPALEKALDGRVLLERDHFYIQSKSGKLEAPLLAEGLRKIGTLAQLVINDTLKPHSIIFWDEPEANLNPALIKTVAKTIIALISKGVQVFIATHSLFLLRELYLLSEKEHSEKKYCYFSFAPQKETPSVHVGRSPSMEGLENIAALSYQLEQDNELLKLFYEQKA